MLPLRLTNRYMLPTRLALSVCITLLIHCKYMMKNLHLQIIFIKFLARRVNIC